MTWLPDSEKDSKAEEAPHNERRMKGDNSQKANFLIYLDAKDRINKRNSKRLTIGVYYETFNFKKRIITDYKK